FAALAGSLRRWLRCSSSQWNNHSFARCGGIAATRSRGRIACDASLPSLTLAACPRRKALRDLPQQVLEKRACILTLPELPRAAASTKIGKIPQAVA
ncbi:MAG: hypothetical protein KDI66_08455, partial [Xanthomonadales bacterium]|nr:hypothetical protein [Xanthomonadales bacterium]